MNRHVIWLVLPVGAFCLGVGIFLGASQNQWFHTQPAVTASKDPEPKVLYWYDPMVPDKHFEQAGKSPFMDMDLVPKYASSREQNAGVSVNPAMVQSLGMRTAQVQRLADHVEFDAIAQLKFNERAQEILQLKFDAFVENVWPLAIGDPIHAGQAIAQFQVPAWLDAQNELLSQPVINNPRLLSTLRARLQLLGMSPQMIAKVERDRQPDTSIIISASLDGVVNALDVKAGMTLTKGDRIISINRLDTLWLDAAIPETQIGNFKAGDTAVFHTANSKTPALTGKIEAILPSINEATRTLTARISLDNSAGKLKPGATGRVILQSNSGGTALFIPTEALIRTGKSTRVMLAGEQGSFYPVTVIAGHEMGDLTLISSGLEEGQRVVSSGQFLLDSEASFLGLEAALADRASHD